MIRSTGDQITDRALEVIAAGCEKSLVELDWNYSHVISDRGLGYLCEKVGDQFKQLSIWGCAQISSGFWNEERELEVLGIWLKGARGSTRKKIESNKKAKY